MLNRLEFIALGVRNFLSYGPKEQRIDLSGDFITCILGENQDTGGEDSRNGTGKSAIIIDALCYALFGKVVRGISNQKLINKMSDKGMMSVWVQFRKDGYEYHVERTERPGKLFLLRKVPPCWIQAAQNATCAGVSGGWWFDMFAPSCEVRRPLSAFRPKFLARRVARSA